MANIENLPTLKWKRPESVEFPKVWHTFKARDIDTDNSVEYRIQDLPLDRVDDYFKHLLDVYIPGEPVGQALGGENDPFIYEDYKRLWEPVIAQRMALVCFKEGSDEIVGASVLYINTIEDNFVTEMTKVFKGYVAAQMNELIDVAYENIDTFKEFNVEKYMASLGLTAHPKYRGRGIGVEFLISRTAVCREFGIKLTRSSFSSDFSDACADKAGYKLDNAISFEEIARKRPKYEKQLANIRSTRVAIRTFVTEPSKSS